MFEEIRLVPNVLRGVDGRAISTELFGETWSASFRIAPMGNSALMALDGDIILARAAAEAGIPFILGGSSLTPTEKVIAANPLPGFRRIFLERRTAYRHWSSGCERRATRPW